MASSLLHILKGVCNKNIVGISKPGKARLDIEVSQKMFLPTVGIRPGLNLFCFFTGGFHGDHVGQIAVICRTNFALFNNVVQTCTRNNKTRIGFAGVSYGTVK